VQKHRPVPCARTGVNASFLLPWYPSGSGLIHRHIVKHIESRAAGPHARPHPFADLTNQSLEDEKLRGKVSSSFQYTGTSVVLYNQSRKLRGQHQHRWQCSTRTGIRIYVTVPSFFLPIACGCVYHPLLLIAVSIDNCCCRRS
jgi:hypothetical protein